MVKNGRLRLETEERPVPSKPSQSALYDDLAEIYPRLEKVSLMFG